MKRRVHFGAVDISAKVFQTLDEAKKALEAFFRKIDRDCKAQGINILMFGVISGSDKESIKRTRYGSRIISSDKIVPPHFHVTFLSEKYSTMEKKLREYLRKTIGENYWIKRIKTKEQLQNRVPYCMTQCWKFRVVNTCSEEFAKRFAGDFILLIEQSNRDIGNGKLVFSQYKDAVLGTDNAVFNYSHVENDNEEDIEVLTKCSRNHIVEANSSSSLNQPPVCKYGEISRYFRRFPFD